MKLMALAQFSTRPVFSRLFVEGKIDGWVDGKTDGWTGDWTGGQLDGWMGGWTDGHLGIFSFSVLRKSEGRIGVISCLEGSPAPRVSFAGKF